MSMRQAKYILLAATAFGTMYQLASCIPQLLFQLAGVTFLDFFVSPFVGDTCTLFNQSGCSG